MMYWIMQGEFIFQRSWERTLGGGDLSSIQGGRLELDLSTNTHLKSTIWAILNQNTLEKGLFNKRIYRITSGTNGYDRKNLLGSGQGNLIHPGRGLRSESAFSVYHLYFI